MKRRSLEGRVYLKDYNYLLCTAKEAHIGNTILNYLAEKMEGKKVKITIETLEE